MKKFIIALMCVGITLAPMQAEAKGRDAALILGGILGGLVIGGALSGVHAAPQPVYQPQPIYQQPAWRQVCDEVAVRRFDRYNNMYYYTYENRCYWIR